MNSVSSPRRPASRARAASAATSGAKCLLPALGLPDRAHPDGDVEPQRAAVAAVDAQLGVLEPRAAEGLERAQQECPAVPDPARPARHGQLADPSGAVLPTLAERDARQALVVLEQQPEGGVEALLVDP